MSDTQINEETVRRDIESYTRGVVPNTLTMLMAPIIDNWRVCFRRRGVDEYLLVVLGNASKHPAMADGADFQTYSPVVWFDRHARFFRTTGELFALGKTAVGDR